MKNTQYLIKPFEPMRNKINSSFYYIYSSTIALCFLFLMSCNSWKTSTNNTSKESISIVITGKVEQLFDYCGGRNPSKIMLDELSKPTPFPDKKFYIKAGNINTEEGKVVNSFTSKADGTFSFQLPEGTYSILVEEQLHKIEAKEYQNQKQIVDEKCLQEWWKTPYYVLVVKKQKNSPLGFIFKHTCHIKPDIPCIRYIGILPR